LSELNTEEQRRAGVVRDERAALTKNTSAVGTAEQTERTAVAALKAARATVIQARESVELAQRANAAAFLSSHLHPGDHCPVCASKVPKRFVAREPQDVAVARGLLEQAESDERKTGVKHTAAQANLQSARDLVAQQAGRVTKTESELAAIDEQVSAICAGVPVEQKLEALNHGVTEANNAAEAARRKVSEGEQEIARTKQAYHGEREQLTTLEGKVKAVKSALDRRDNTIADLVKALPQPWLPDEKSTVDALLGKLEKERVRSEKVEDDYRKAQDAKTTVTNEMTKLERELEKLVNRPLQSLRDRATAYARDLGHAPPTPDLTADNQYFDMLVEVLATKVSALIDKRAELVSQRGEVEAQRSALVEAAGGDIPGRHALALVEVGQFEERLQSMNALVRQVAAVEQTIAAVVPVHGALDAIAKATAANQFPEFLTNQYVARLLTIGSDYFMEMTERFRFVLPNFEGRAADKELRILDVQAGATMLPQDLSGGEKFLASLALSLAVVDQAALAGAKIDSLFLDEGFASLDSIALDKAMMELRARARKGRSIWVITHLREVARYAERTYRVEKGPNGSTVALNDGDIEEPIDTAGLLTVLT
jgi:exonuclease SbcC